MKLLSIFLLSLVFSNCDSNRQVHDTPLPAVSTPFVMGVVEKMKSTVLSEDRILNIYLPENYATDSAATYPVIYLLDGSANEDFIHVAGIVQFMNMIGSMPPSIVVGIANVDRKRDFSFPTTVEQDKKVYPTTGGSEKFMAFIEKELQPFIQGKYRVNDLRTIIGQSLGGLFASEVLLKKPDLFNQYIIVSPSLWWDNESLLKKTSNYLKNLSDSEIQAYISVGSEGKEMETATKNLGEFLGSAGSENMKIHFDPLPEESHLTILHNSVYRAFQKLYPDWK